MKSKQKRTLSYTAFKVLGGKHTDLLQKKGMVSWVSLFK